MRGAALVVAVLALALAAPGLAAPARAPSPTPAGPEAPPPSGALTGAAYADALAVIDALLERGEWESARTQAGALRGARVGDGGAVFDADPTVIAVVEAAKDAASAVRARARVGRVLQSLGRSDAAAAVPVDVATLARLAREQEARRPRAGGDVDATVPVRTPTVPEQMREWLRAAVDWVAKWIERLFDWLLRRRVRPERRAEGSTATVVTLLVAVVVAVLAFAAVRSLRRRDDGQEQESTEASSSGRDENPLSREADEWERYAAELAAAGRRREAVRAWYHAVLVALFRSGRLHHQTGRTNWEYVAQLGPGPAWRRGFVDLTLAFDREWYGRTASSVEALRECAARAGEILHAVRAEPSS